MTTVHQTNTFYDSDPYNPLTWATHVVVKNLTTGNTDTSTLNNLYDGDLTTFCETNALPSNGEIRLIKYDRTTISPSCPTMKRPLRLWIRNFTSGSLEFYVDNVNLVVNTNSAAETATGGWVDVATGSGTVSSWEVRATAANANVSIAAVEGGGVLHCNTFDRIVFNENFLSTTVDNLCVSSSHLIANTNTPVLTATFSSIERVTGASGTPKDHSFTDLDAGLRGWIHGRRPTKGLQYPRGYYNK
tara:strand:+ start:572 stop:1306 length:735 start_codon:yes stop_codon:yes gene_type:complete